MADLPVIEFIQARLAENDVTLEARRGSAFYDLFIKPQQLMLEPLFDSMETIFASQSVKRVLDLDDPNSFSEDLVDDLAGNVYISRAGGDFSRTTVRVYYDEPVDREFPAFSAEFSTGTLSFFNEQDILITKQQMALQQSGLLYYMDVPVRSQSEGTAYNVGADSITQFVNDPLAVTVANAVEAVGGLDRETNAALLNRARSSIGVRDLETVKGINAILLENFPYLQQIQAVGMGDPEMMRDIVYNVHTGGATDIYLKTPTLLTKTADIIGLVFDTTRELQQTVSLQLTAKTFDDPLAELATPYIVSASVQVKDDIVETSARVETEHVPAVTGIDLSAGEWIKISVDGAPFVNIKVSGAVPSATQRFEIINALNAYTGLALAAPKGVDKIALTSPSVGATSVIRFSKPDGARTDATLVLFPSAAGASYATTPSVTEGIFSGVAAAVYLENIDYQVDYTYGKIRQLPGTSILSGSVVAETISEGYGQVTPGSNLFQVALPTAFVDVRVGDVVTITSSSALSEGDYIVQEKVSDQSLRLLGASPTASDFTIEYKITSSQTVAVSYAYYPLSVDIGGQVVLSDGVTRGVRPGRDNFTIGDTAFIAIQSIVEIDPDTGESLGVELVPPTGYGSGGFGMGGFGLSSGGDYRLIVNSAVDRFSALEDSTIIFNYELFGKSYRISYYAAPEIADIHGFCRNDLQRVTGADILPKNFIPGFVDMDIVIRQDITNINAPTTDELVALVLSHIHTISAGAAIQASEVVKILENAGVGSVRTPFTMTVKVLNTDGSTSVYSSEDLLEVPSVTLPKRTDNFVTPRIVHFYPGTITVREA